jgi:hypothetical protein
VLREKILDRHMKARLSTAGTHTLSDDRGLLHMTKCLVSDLRDFLMIHDRRRDGEGHLEDLVGSFIARPLG